MIKRRQPIAEFDRGTAGLRLSRREALLGGGALMGAGLMAGGAAAATLGAPGVQAPGVFRFALGEAAITVLSDGHLEIPALGVAANAEPDEVKAFLAARHLDTEIRYSHTNLTLIELGEARVLVDIGSGDRFQPTAGKLAANLEAAEIDPASITHLVMTHAHPDHIWGVWDDFEEASRTPEAEHLIGATEYDWWMAEGRVDAVPEVMKPFVVGAVNSLQPVQDRLRMLSDGADIAPGVTAVATPGHTPGHLSVRVESAGQSLLVFGDAVAAAYASFERPEWVGAFDMDGETAVATRKRLLDMTASEGTAVIGYHFPFPGVGHVARQGEVYRFIPAVWRWAG